MVLLFWILKLQSSVFKLSDHVRNLSIYPLARHCHTGIQINWFATQTLSKMSNTQFCATNNPVQWFPIQKCIQYLSIFFLNSHYCKNNLKLLFFFMMFRRLLENFWKDIWATFVERPTVKLKQAPSTLLHDI